MEGEQQTPTAANRGNEIYRVGPKFLPFWPEKPVVWFAQIEGQFAIANITTDATKFYHVISQLEPQYANEVEDIIVSPPATGKYEKLKIELIKRLGASKEKKVKQLLIHEELGDRKPSQFLRHLQNLAGPEVPTDFLRTIWTSRLPNNIQTIIASQPDSSLEAAADLADKIQDIAPQRPQVVAAASPDVLSDLVKHVAALTSQIKKLEVQNHRYRSGNRGDRRYSRGDSRNNSRSRSASARGVRSDRNHSRFPVCWYHHKFGSQASKCAKPCDYNTSENAIDSR